ncbi:iron-siderophore ABC transporter substrate-binding protein [Kineothrix sp. MB12-C1]|uniref:iron-siderophore ABC transporter substrate-binding protein n=1 Tax=Kineothrix sp. MB12-C1 TaxID=3070215 RepID=UPI0027D2B4BD|nr:iron-siderophore ABC transporter substrate-binding protein [Kineothrix sp. MB12-C1]WMC91455.1 iron-siderophore ABC transporter substrate-binding protein [Kineothrix sp. MB12-C1]
MKRKMLSSILALTLAFSLTACSAGTKEEASNISDAADASNTLDEVVSDEADAEDVSAQEEDTEYPIIIEHAYGQTIIEAKPERVATISWGNQDTPLALGVSPVGISEANYGVIDGSGILPWTKTAIEELGADTEIFKDTAGLDYEAISDVQPDVILAAYSGITQEEYDLLSQIAPVVAYPNLAWQTYWRDQIIMDATGMGMQDEGEQLVADLDGLIAQKAGDYPQIQGKKAAFFYFMPTDLGTFYVYLPTDPRAAYLLDLGMEFPESVLALATESGSFSLEMSAENADALQDIDIIIAYGNSDLLEALQADALLGTIPAIQNGSVAMIEDGTPIAASSTPSALSIPATIDDYLKLIGEAADKVK